MRLAIEHDGAHLNDLQTELELADLEGLGAIADYSILVVFMQRCDGGECLGAALNSTEAQLTALLAATATAHAAALETRVAAERLKDANRTASELEEQLAEAQRGEDLLRNRLRAVTAAAQAEVDPVRLGYARQLLETVQLQMEPGDAGW